MQGSDLIQRCRYVDYPGLPSFPDPGVPVSSPKIDINKDDLNQKFMVNILFEFNNGSVPIGDCVKAMLFGMNNPGENASADQKKFVSQAFKDILQRYDIKESDLELFNQDQVNSPNIKKIPSNCD